MLRGKLSFGGLMWRKTKIKPRLCLDVKMSVDTQELKWGQHDFPTAADRAVEELRWAARVILTPAGGEGGTRVTSAVALRGRVDQFWPELSGETVGTGSHSLPRCEEMWAAPRSVRSGLHREQPSVLSLMQGGLFTETVHRHLCCSPTTCLFNLEGIQLYAPCSHADIQRETDSWNHPAQKQWKPFLWTQHLNCILFCMVLFWIKL